MQKVLSREKQTELLTSMALMHMTRNDLSQAIGISIPTMRKVLDAPTPVVVSAKTLESMENWLDKASLINSN